MSRRAPAFAFLALALAGVSLATLVPGGSKEVTTSLQCVFCSDRALADLLVNVILYVPVGLGLALTGMVVRRAVALGFLLSTAVEFVQLVLPGRDASLGDVVANTIGTAVGTGLIQTAAGWLIPSGLAARGLALSWALVVAGAFAATGWLLMPSLPPTRYYGQWTPNLGHLEWYRGHVLDAAVSGDPIGVGRVGASDELRRSFLGGAPITVDFEVGPRAPGLASLFSVYDEYREEIFLIGPDQDELVIRYRRRAADFMLDRPDLRWPAYFASLSPGDTARILVTAGSRGTQCVRRDARDECRGFTVGAGWGLLLFAESFPAWLRAALSWAWLAALAIPVGFWSRERTTALGGAGLLAGSLWIVPGLVNLARTPMSSWTAVTLGLIGGLGLGRMVSRWGAARESTVR